MAGESDVKKLDSKTVETLRKSVGKDFFISFNGARATLLAVSENGKTAFIRTSGGDRTTTSVENLRTTRN